MAPARGELAASAPPLRTGGVVRRLQNFRPSCVRVHALRHSALDICVLGSQNEMQSLTALRRSSVAEGYVLVEPGASVDLGPDVRVLDCDPGGVAGVGRIFGTYPCAGGSD